jgi:outer membrane biosynthesis protein TonB
MGESRDGLPRRGPAHATVHLVRPTWLRIDGRRLRQACAGTLVVAVLLGGVASTHRPSQQRDARSGASGPNTPHGPDAPPRHAPSTGRAGLPWLAGGTSVARPVAGRQWSERDARLGSPSAAVRPDGAIADGAIPPVAMDAYRRSAAAVACGADWALLAGIARVESDHGRFGGAALLADGTSTRKIIGIALDGTRSALIRDTDHGSIDGDTVFDRAVGPMQFIPSTWASWRSDGNGDSLSDPFNLYDAALAAARYLCAAGRDLSTDAGRARAVLAYNHSQPYLAAVLRYRTTYLRQGLQLTAPVAPPRTVVPPPTSHAATPRPSTDPSRASTPPPQRTPSPDSPPASSPPPSCAPSTSPAAHPSASTSPSPSPSPSPSLSAAPTPSPPPSQTETPTTETSPTTGTAAPSDSATPTPTASSSAPGGPTASCVLLH